MGFFPFLTPAQLLAGQTVPGALTITGLLTTQAGVANSGANITSNQNYAGSGTASITVPGNVDVTLAGDGLRVAEGSNAKQGLTAAMTAGAITVANTATTANSRIIATGQVLGGTAGGVNVSARTAGTSFTLTSTNAADTSQVGFEMFEPG